jgi:putative phage-type endonuclease
MNAPQGSGAWLNARVGFLTASQLWRAMDVRKDGKPGAERIKLLKEKLAERLTGDAVPHYVNDLMKWGLEHEPAGKAEFEAATGILLQDVGFVPHQVIQFFGASPDALIDTDAVFELKCPQTTTHIGWIEDTPRGQIPEQHRPQVLAQLACTKRSRVIFASYDPRIAGKHRLWVREWTPKAEEIEAIEQVAVEFLRELDARFDVLMDSD